MKAPKIPSLSEKHPTLRGLKLKGSPHKAIQLLPHTNKEKGPSRIPWRHPAAVLNINEQKKWG